MDEIAPAISGRSRRQPSARRSLAAHHDSGRGPERLAASRRASRDARRRSPVPAVRAARSEAIASSSGAAHVLRRAGFQIARRSAADSRGPSLAARGHRTASPRLVGL